MRRFKETKGFFAVIWSLTVVFACYTRTYAETAPARPPADLREGLIGHWTFDDKANPGKDISGRDHHGVLKGPVWREDVSGGGILLFDGRDDYVDLGDVDEYEFGPKDRFTISLWVKPLENQRRVDKAGAKKAARAFVFGRANDTKDRRKFTWVVSHAVSPRLVMGNGGRKRASHSIGELAYGPWYHLVVVVGAQGEVVESYRNGVKTKSGKRTIGQLAQSTHSFRIGGEYLYYYFTGGIDDVRIYNRALDQKEILALNAEMKKPPTARSQELRFFMNTSTPVNIKASDPNHEDAVVHTIVKKPVHGVLSGKAPRLIYTPERNFTGEDSFSFKVSDGKQDSSATVTMDISVPAFPGAEGFGARSRGGRGGKVIKVTNLNAKGPGSLQWACGQEGAKIIVFDVSGVISPSANRKGRRFIYVDTSNTTIAGQTAPGAGITINGVLSSERGHGRERVSDLVMRFLRVRPNATGRGNLRTIEGSNTENMILDHISGSWNVDVCFEMFANNDNITIQWCAIEESDVQLESGSEPHNFAAHLGYGGPRHITFHHNLMANHHHRAPLTGAFPVDVSNNILYNIGTGMRFLIMRDADKYTMNVIGNYSKAGPAGLTGSRIYIPPYTAGCGAIAPQHEPRDSGRIFLKGNYFEWDGGYTERWRFVARKPKCVVDEKFNISDIKTHTAEEAYELLMAHGGCLPRDAVSRRTIREVETGTGSWGAHRPNGGLMEGLTPGKPPADADNDGMPDAWEKAHGLNPADPADCNKIVPSGASKNDRHMGYTYIEYYINELADKLVAGALTAYRTSTTEPKPWDRPADGISDLGMEHAGLDEMLQSIRDQNLALHNDKYWNSFSAWYAVQRLNRMGDKAKRVVPELMKLVAGEDPRQATFAAWALGAIGPAAKEAGPVLIASLKKKWSCPKGAGGWPLRPSEFAAWALGRIGPPADEGALSALCAYLTKESMAYGSREPACYSLYRLVNEASVEAVPVFLDERNISSYHAPFGLARIGSPAIPSLVKALGRKSGSERVQVIRALGLMGEVAKTTVPALVERLKDKHPLVRAAAAHALGEIDPASQVCVTALATVLDDPEMNVRHAALKALARSGKAAVDILPALEHALLEDPDREVVRTAAATLGAVGRKAIPVLSGILVSEGKPFARKHAARVLGRMGAKVDDKSVIPVLIKALSDKNVEVRREAVWALALMGPEAKKAAAVLKETSESDSDYVVRYAAAEALKKVRK